MADTRFHIRFDGSIAEGASPEAARRQLGALFKLDEQGVARLFSGKPVLVKRNVDEGTANQFRQLFAKAGAIVEVIPAETEAPVGSTPRPEPTPAAPPAAPATSAGLALAPQGGFLEAPPAANIPPPDTSHLSLVAGPDWSLEDCETPPTGIQTPDTSHLSLADPEPIQDENRDRAD